MAKRFDEWLKERSTNEWIDEIFGVLGGVGDLILTFYWYRLISQIIDDLLRKSPSSQEPQIQHQMQQQAEKINQDVLQMMKLHIQQHPEEIERFKQISQDRNLQHRFTQELERAAEDYARSDPGMMPTPKRIVAMVNGILDKIGI